MLVYQTYVHIKSEKQDREICLTAVRQNKEALNYVTDPYLDICLNELKRSH